LKVVLADVKAWMKEVGRTGKAGGDRDDDLRKQRLRAQIRKDIAQAERYEMELQIRRGELLDREDVEQGRLDRVAFARAVLLGGPARLAPDLVGLGVEEIEQQLSAWIDEALKELAS